MTLPSEGLFYPPLRRDEGKKACPRVDLGWGLERVKAFKLIISVLTSLSVPIFYFQPEQPVLFASKADR
jgi:hypothetical protein